MNVVQWKLSIFSQNFAFTTWLTKSMLYFCLNYLLQIDHNQSLSQILNLSLHPGGNRIANLAMLTPSTVRPVIWHNRPYPQCIADGHDRPSLFFLVGCVSYSQICTTPSYKKSKTSFQLCVTPFDWAWNRICGNIAIAIPSDRFFIPTYMGSCNLFNW